jgi:hypothetical protein
MKKHIRILSITMALLILSAAPGAQPFALALEDAPNELEPMPRYGRNGEFIAPILPPADGSIPISTRAELEAIGASTENLQKTYHLANDIDLGGEAWTPIGPAGASISNPDTAWVFQGVFDGQGYAIKNMAMDISDTSMRMATTSTGTGCLATQRMR